MKEIDYLTEFINQQGYIKELDKNPALSFILYKSLKSKNFQYKSTSESLISSVLTDKINLKIYNDEIKQVIENATQKSGNEIKNDVRIKNISAKNFRSIGEYSKEDQGLHINFNKKYNIFFAPNGGGKTTICEALEYGITDNIKEAQKRKLKIKNYIKNILSSGELSTLPPNLKITLTNGENAKDFLCNYKKELLELCFIEKNRIQEFVLLGSEDTSTSSSDILSDLIGTESLDYLFSSFIDFKSFKIDNLLQNQAIDEFKKKENERKELQIKQSGIIEKLNKYKNKSKNLINDLEISKDYSEERLNYYDELEKRIDTLTFLLQDDKLIKKQTESLKESYKKILEIRKYLTDNLSDFQFSKLFASIKELNENEDSDKTQCPACNTPIDSVKINPFQNADINLVKFNIIDEKQKELKEWGDKYTNYKNVLLEEINKISENINNIKSYLPQENFEEIETYISHMNTTTNEAEKHSLISQILTYEKIDNYYKKLSFCATEHTKKTKVKNAIKIIRNVINRNIGDNEATIKQIKSLFDELKEIKKTYKDVNFEPIKQRIKKEQEINKFLDSLKTNYDNFYKKLANFVRNKKKDDFDHIKADVIYFYNLINDHKKNDEKIEDIDLKLNEYQKGIIKIKLTNQSELVGATMILSEGHLRCLGLALMLAAIKRNENKLLPLIIFDDVINAIDIEHRDNILNLFFNNEFFCKKQIIITTHDRIFWEKFCNLYESRIGKSKEISFVLFHDKISGVYYEKYNVSYHEKITKSLFLYDIRQSLIYLRLLFEKSVFEYCVKNNLKGEFKFNKNNGIYNKKGCIVSLESMYTVCAKHLKEKEDAIFFDLFSSIKNTLTFNFLNQEHHSFQNHGYELTHSKTSTELEETYENIKNFEKCVFGKSYYLNKIINIIKVFLVNQT